MDEYEDTGEGQTIAIVMYANFSACLSAGLSILAGHSEGVGRGVLGTVAVGGSVAMLYVLAGLQVTRLITLLLEKTKQKI